MGQEKAHRFEINGWSEESGNADDEKKAEIIEARGVDEERLYSQVLACVKGSWRKILSWWSEKTVE